LTIAKWTIPYIDQPIDFWKLLRKEFHPFIKSVYLPIPGINTGSGRPLRPDRHVNKFLDSKVFPVSLLINAMILKNTAVKVFESIRIHLKKAIYKWWVDEIIVTDLNLANFISNEFSGLSITASTLMNIYSPSQLIYLENIDSIVPSTYLVRKPELLSVLKNNYSGKIRLIVNEGCLSKCPFRTQHFYEMINDDLIFPESLCTHILNRHPWLRLTGAWILPQHLHLLDGLYDELKLSGRITLSKPERYVHVLSHYINRKPLMAHEIGGGPASVYKPIKISEDFYKQTLKCKGNCLLCNYCQDYWNKNLNLGDFRKNVS